ncbi:TPA: hypothetical protein ACXLHF_003984 [Klebsiella pneumoniae]
MIDLKKIVVAIENYADSQELSHKGKLIVDDALYLLLDEVMDEGITEINGAVDLAYHISQCRVENRGLTFSDFVELVNGASLGIVCTDEIFKHYLTEEDYAKWQNDTLDMSKFLGHKKGLEDIYLQAEYLYDAYHLILKFCEIQTLLNE